MSIKSVGMQPSFTAKINSQKEKSTWKNPYFLSSVAILGGATVYLATRGKAKKPGQSVFKADSIKTAKEAYRSAYVAVADNLVETFTRSKMRASGAVHLLKKAQYKGLFRTETEIQKRADVIKEMAMENIKKPTKDVAQKIAKKTQRAARNLTRKLQKTVENKV